MVEKFFVTIMGCTKRRLDCERIKNYFIANQLQQVDSPELADYIVVSTCGLSEFFERESIKLILDAKKQQGQVIVFGCMPSMNPERIHDVFDGEIVHTQTIDDFDRIFPDFPVKFADVPDANSRFEETGKNLKEKIKYELRKLDLHYPLQLYNVCLVLAEQLRAGINTVLPWVFPSPFITRIPLSSVNPDNMHFSLRISKGCMGNCSYCNIKTAIGRLRSKPIPLLLEELERGLANGEYTININSSDTGSYGLDIGSSLPMKRILGSNRSCAGHRRRPKPFKWIQRIRLACSTPEGRRVCPRVRS